MNEIYQNWALVIGIITCVRQLYTVHSVQLLVKCEA